MRPIIIALVVVIWGAIAAPAASRADLTPDAVERFMATVAPVSELVAEHRRPLRHLARAMARAPQPHRSTLFTDAIGRTRAAPARHALAVIVAEHGFDSPEAWARVADRVVVAYAALRLGAQRDSLSRGLDRARRAVETNPRLKRQDREVLLAELDSGAAVLDRLRAPEDDIAAVAPHVAALRRSFAALR